MPYTNIHWIKLEKRLLNDHRFYLMNEESQLIFLKFLMLAAEMNNKIPKKTVIVKSVLRSNQTEEKIKECINEIKMNFPKFKEHKEFYYFKEWTGRLNQVYPKDIPRISKGYSKDAPDKIREDKIRDKIREDKIRDKISKDIKEDTNNDVSVFFSYYLEKTKKHYRLTKDSEELIKKRLKEGYTIEQLKTAVNNFVKDDWPGRPQHLELIYCIGKQQGKPDALERWLNITPVNPMDKYLKKES